MSSLKATIDFKKAPGCSHDSLKKPFGAAAWHAGTLAGSVYGFPNVPNTRPSAASTAGAREHRRAGVAAADTAVVRKREALPEQLPGLRVHGGDVAAEGRVRARSRRPPRRR